MVIHQITCSINLEVDIAGEQHQGDIEERLLVGTGTGLGHLGRAEGNLGLPEEERPGSLVQLDMQGVVEDSQQVDTKLRDKVKLGGNHQGWAAAVDIVACKVVLEDKLVIEDRLLDRVEEDIEQVVVEDNQILQLPLERPSNSLILAWHIRLVKLVQRLEQLQLGLFMLHQE